MFIIPQEKAIDICQWYIREINPEFAGLFLETIAEIEARNQVFYTGETFSDIGYMVAGC